MIQLRKLKKSDVPRIAELLNNKKIWDNLRNYIPYPYKESDAEFFVDLVNNDDSQEVFAIEYEGDFCGVISLILLQGVYEKTAELGYWLGETYWGKGIVSKAVNLITTYGFNDLKLVRIHTGVYEYNIASMKVLEKNGYEKDGIFKKAILKNGKIWDEHRYYKLSNL